MLSRSALPQSYVNFSRTTCRTKQKITRTTCRTKCRRNPHNMPYQGRTTVPLCHPIPLRRSCGFGGRYGVFIPGTKFLIVSSRP